MSTQALLQEIDYAIAHGWPLESITRITKIRAAIAKHHMSGSGWMPIETAPKDGTEVLLWEALSTTPFIGSWRGGRRSGWECCTEHYDTDGNACVVSNLWQEGVTHWMPLPPPPKTED